MTGLPTPRPATSMVPAPVEGNDPRRTPDCPYNAVTLRETNPNETEVFCRCSQSATEGGNVWGSGPYTGDSSICRAAKHAGYWRGEGDEVRVSLREGQDRYEGSEAFGIRTESYGPFESSFVIR